MSNDGDDVRALRAQMRALRDRVPTVLPIGELREQADQRLRDLMVRAARLERGDPPSESDSRRHRLPPEPPGRQWLKHAPGVLDCYIVCRRFTTDDGEIVRPDEIICPGLGWWEDRPFRTVLVADGYVEPLTDDRLAYQCPHLRFFATPEALAEHGCAELPADGEDTPQLAVAPYVPKKPAVRRRWRATWLKVRPESERGKSYVEMAEWVSRDPNLKVSPDILAKIIRAGEAGLLD